MNQLIFVVALLWQQRLNLHLWFLFKSLELCQQLKVVTLLLNLLGYLITSCGLCHIDDLKAAHLLGLLFYIKLWVEFSIVIFEIVPLLAVLITTAFQQVQEISVFFIKFDLLLLNLLLAYLFTLLIVDVHIDLFLVSDPCNRATLETDAAFISLLDSFDGVQNTLIVFADTFTKVEATGHLEHPQGLLPVLHMEFCLQRVDFLLLFTFGLHLSRFESTEAIR